MVSVLDQEIGGTSLSFGQVFFTLTFEPVTLKRAISPFLFPPEISSIAE